MNRTPEKRMDSGPEAGGAILAACQTLVAQLFSDSGAASWNLPQASFAEALAVSATKHFPSQSAAPPELEAYLRNLHLQDLALACACAEGRSPAWDHFVAAYRAYLRSAAAAILRCDAASPAARDLADTLFADLYGLGEAPGRRSLFRYFHGRSSLKTWLRAVLAQRHIDSLRLSRRFAELPEEQDLAALHSPAAAPARVTHPEDPHRERYLRLFHHALESALAGLEPRDRQRLRMYYAEEKTLADIGRELREHESSVSRNLERVRRELRQQVELALRKGQEKADGTTNALSEAEVALCLEYAAEDAPIDLDTMFPTRAAPAAAKERKP